LQGFVGGVGAKLLELRGHRLAHLRERQLDAADDFASAATAVFIRLGADMEALGSPAGREVEWLAALRAAVDEARQSVHDVTARSPRVELLFGRGKAPSSAAVQAVENIHRMSAELTRAETDVETVTTAFESGADALGDFTDAVHGALTTPMWKPVNAPRPRAALPAPDADGSVSTD
jgi:hypothetical protein